MSKPTIKVKRLVTHTNNTEIIETILQDDVPTFAQCTLQTKKINFLETVEVAKEKHFPMKSTNSFLVT